MLVPSSKPFILLHWKLHCHVFRHIKLFEIYFRYVLLTYSSVLCGLFPHGYYIRQGRHNKILNIYVSEILWKKFNETLRADSQDKLFKSIDVLEKDPVSIISINPDDGDKVVLWNLCWYKKRDAAVIPRGFVWLFQLATK